MGIRRYLKRTLMVLLGLVLSVPSLSAGTVNAIGEECPTPFSQHNVTATNINPEVISKGGDGAIWFGEFTSKIGRFSNGTTSEFATSGQVSDIAAGTGSDTWITSGNTVAKVTSGGQSTNFSLGQGNSGTSLTYGSDGALWVGGVSDVTSGSPFIPTIFRITTSGTVTSYPLTLTHENNYVRSVTNGPDGAVWFIYQVGNQAKIGRIDVTTGSTSFFPLNAESSASTIITGPDGNLWFNGYQDSNPMLGSISTTGNITIHQNDISSLISTNDLTVGPDGKLWFGGNGTLARVTLSPFNVDYYYNQATLPAIPSSNIVSGSDGALWFATDSNTLTRLAMNDLPAVATPSGFSRSGDLFTPSFTWAATSGAASYLVCKDGIVVHSTNSTNFTDTNASDATSSYYTIVATDSSGNHSARALGIEMSIDTHSPTIGTPTLSATQILHEETSTLDVEADDASGVYRTRYSINGGEQIDMQHGGFGGSDPHLWTVTFSQSDTEGCGIGCIPTTHQLQNGVYTIAVQAVDNVGRVSETKTVTLTVGLVTPTGLSVVKSPTNSAPVLNWNNQQRTDHYNIYRDSNPTPIATSTTPTYTDNSSLADGTHTYKVSAVDDQSNETAQSSAVSVVVDKTAPTVTNLVLNPTLILLTGTLSISADASDALSGVTGGEYFVDTDPGQGNATPMTFNSSTGKLTATRSVTSSNTSTGNHTVKVRSKDAAGNWSALVTKTFFKL